ncbi:MAG TPA: LytR C-terminal domain-containing protein [Candidatus Krumholzibacteria bacterium]|nr:LytR C-terminal domain-containing protein [Candidatus Krumholzibacteria bacterium]HRX51666.1 LytR C-terminal domain-containing protein [Candidatus Krumholzibacteria bacterium]
MRLGTVLLLLLCAAALISVGVRVTHPGGKGESEAEPAALLSAAPDHAAPVRLEVLNGAGVDGLAGLVATAVGRAGCVAGELRNAEGADLPRSLLLNRALTPERARALAQALGGLPVRWEADAASDADAALLLGADHARVLAALGLAPDPERSAR